jgi:hypothetical protein
MKYIELNWERIGSKDGVAVCVSEPSNKPVTFFYTAGIRAISVIFPKYIILFQFTTISYWSSYYVTFSFTCFSLYGFKT